MKVAAALVAVTLLALPASAEAAGSATLTLPASLKARGIGVAVKAPATVQGRTVTFPLADSAPDAARLQARGALRLTRGERGVTLASPQVVPGTRVTALLGAQRTTVLTLDGSQATLAPTAARTIARRLRVAKLSRAFGSLTATVTRAAAPPPGACTATTAPGAAPDPGSGEPPVKAAPPGALSVASATVVWHVRDSFIQYIASGEGTSAGGGAAGEPPTVEGGSQASLVYGFRYTPTGGWCDPATGAARLTFAGTVGFSYRDHGIDLRVNDPEVELDGPASRVIFRMTGAQSTDGGNRRAVVETLDVSKAAAVRVDGKTITYERIPAAVPPGTADSVFAGYYLPGDPFGWVSITFTTA